MASVSLKPSPFCVEKSAGRGLPSLARTSSSSFRVQASGVKKIKTSTPYGMYVCVCVCVCIYDVIIVILFFSSN
jgi:hypothetical protein